MIVRETNSHYILIKQHEHGLLSGKIAYYWGNQTFPDIPYNLILATSLHDYSWIASDASLPWNETERRPYDFSNLPDHIRLQMYENGLNEVETIHPYAALVTSFHYCSFLSRGKTREIDEFLDKEQKRQQRLRFNYYNKNLSFNLRQLKLFDNLSLYLCLNRPGAKKEQEHPWYKDGFNAVIDDDRTIQLQARWTNEHTIALKPFPFSRNWTASLRYSLCRKSLGKKDPDLGQQHNHLITFVPDSE